MKKDGRYFRGSSGPHVHRVYRGEQIIQSKPVYTPGSQTKATKKAANIFGKNSSLAAAIRHNLYPFLNEMHDGPMIGRLNAEVLYCLRNCINEAGTAFEPGHNSFNRLDGFEFNILSPLVDQMHIDPELSLQEAVLTVTLPDIYKTGAISYPKNATGCFIEVGIGFQDLHNGRKTLSPIQTLNLVQGLPPEGSLSASFDFEIPSGCLCIVTMSITYYKKTFSGPLLLNSKTMNPAVILAAFMSEGEPDANLTKTWIGGMTFKLQIEKKP